MYRDILVQPILPLAPGLIEKLEGYSSRRRGLRSGNGTLALARRFPNSTFVGTTWMLRPSLLRAPAPVN